MAQESVQGSFTYDAATGELKFIPAGGSEVPGPPGIGGLASQVAPMPPGATPLGSSEPREALRNLGIMAGKTAELGIGLSPARAVVRSLGLLPVGAMTGALMNEEDPMMGALTEAGSQAGMQLGSQWLGEKLPAWGVKAGLLTGGARGSLRDRVDDIVDAFLRVRERRGFGKGIPIGQQKRTTGARLRAGEDIARAEESVPGRDVDLEMLRGAVYRRPMGSPKTPSVIDKLQGADDPHASRVQAHGMEWDLITAQRRQIPGLIRQGRPPLTRKDISVREAGETLRGWRSGPGYDKLLAAHREHGNVPPGDILKAQVKEALARELQEQQQAVAGMAGVPLRELNRHASDLHKMEEANRALRGGGRLLAELGIAGVRGGLGAGLGSGLAAVGGGDPRTGGTVGGLYGVFGASPAMLSRQGFAAGRLAPMFPTTARAYDLATDVSSGDISGKKPVKKREPKK